MKNIIITGGQKLEGEVYVSGSKNSSLAIIAASLLCRDKVKLYNCPNIRDVNIFFQLLKEINVDINVNDDFVEIDSSRIINEPITSEHVSKLRASYYLMGVYLALFNSITINMPGGCDLGSRPIDLHLKGFKNLNCDYSILNKEVVKIKTTRLKSSKLFLEIPSVGATVNLMLASIKIRDGITIIENAAKEPEIVDLAVMLNKMGAKISGAGTNLITIEGVKSLHGTEHKIMYDRIEAGTYIAIAAANCKEVDILNFDYKYNNGLITKLIESNIKFRLYDNKIKILKSDDILPIRITTSYYPGFPTDLQQIYLALLTKAKGMSIIHDNIYKKRFKNCDELLKMGAKLTVNKSTAHIYGPNKLIGTTVSATDLRGGASLIVAGVMADGETIINQANNIFRGYSNILEKIRNINGQIKINNV